MIITKIPIEGAYSVEREPIADKRGYFARFYCQREFKNAGIDVNFPQMNICRNTSKGTLRGLHFQTGDYAEDKVVSCVRGKIFDVLVDVRKNSPTFCKYYAAELSEENGRMLYIPKGCAHGYLTLENDCQLIYLMSEFYVPDKASGYRYNDPAFGINWPFTDGLIISEKDMALPFINDQEE